MQQLHGTLAAPYRIAAAPGATVTFDGTLDVETTWQWRPTTFELTNGIKLPWLRYFGWLVTVPVLLMFLVSLTVHGGRSATVRPHCERPRLSGTPKPEPDHQPGLWRWPLTQTQVPLVPLLVSSQVMVLLGVTAAACSPPLKVRVRVRP